MEEERNAFIDYLSRLAADGLLAEDDALALLAQYDGGALPRAWLDGLPTAPTAQEMRFDSSITPVALALLLVIAGRLRSGATASAPPVAPVVAQGGAAAYQLTSVTVPHGLAVTVRIINGAGALTLPASVPTTLAPLGVNVGRPLSLAHVRMINSVQAEFDITARYMGDLLSAGRITPEEFRQQMMMGMQHNLQQQAMIGSGRTFLTEAEETRIGTILGEQGAYLSRFADQAHANNALGTPYSAEYVGNRAELYGGPGRALAFEMAEGEADQMLGPGWVIRYVSHDDPNRCAPCERATGYYLIGSAHPVPVRNCEGGRHCRCYLLTEYNPAQYARLTGAPA